MKDIFPFFFYPFFTADLAMIFGSLSSPSNKALLPTINGQAQHGNGKFFFFFLFLILIFLGEHRGGVFWPMMHTREKSIVRL